MIVTDMMRPPSAALLSRSGRLGQTIHRGWSLLGVAVKRFLGMNGTTWAAAFSFHAFFSLFPLIILIVTIASSFAGCDGTGKDIIGYVESYLPLGGRTQRHLVDTITSVIKSRHQVGLGACLILAWATLQCFNTSIGATNRAWRLEVHSWWQVPLKSLLLLMITMSAVFLGMTMRLVMRMVTGVLFAAPDHGFWVYNMGSSVISLLLVFVGLSLFYRLAPRRPTRFAEVWAAALCATLLLRAGESLFLIYLRHFATLNAVYGALGGIMALLLWIYVSGCVVIFGACLCATLADTNSL